MRKLKLRELTLWVLDRARIHLFICELCAKHRKDTAVKRLKISALLEQINSYIMSGGGKYKRRWRSILGSVVREGFSEETTWGRALKKLSEVWRQSLSWQEPARALRGTERTRTASEVHFRSGILVLSPEYELLFFFFLNICIKNNILYICYNEPVCTHHQA